MMAMLPINGVCADVGPGAFGCIVGHSDTIQKRGSGMFGPAVLFTWPYNGVHVHVPCDRAESQEMN